MFPCSLRPLLQKQSARCVYSLPCRSEPHWTLRDGFDHQTGFVSPSLQDGKPAAQLLITYEWSDWRNCQVWWIQSVYVVEEKRRQGLFKALYEAVRQLCGRRHAVAATALGTLKRCGAVPQMPAMLQERSLFGALRRR